MATFLPTYFSPIAQYGAIYHSDELIFETEDNFQKQSYRNRCYIYGANGKQLLNIPVSHPITQNRKKTKDTLVENNSNWQQQHFKSLKSAYNSSPFFEFYIDDLMPVFNKKYKYLHDVNLDTFIILNELLLLEKEYSKTTTYMTTLTNDFRFLAKSKTETTTDFQPYTQVFDDKFGFIPNLSILDLLFMEGPNAISFLEKVNVTLE